MVTLYAREQLAINRDVRCPQGLVEVGQLPQEAAWYAAPGSPQMHTI